MHSTLFLAVLFLVAQPNVTWTVGGLVSNYETEVDCGRTSLLPLDGYKLLVVRGQFSAAGAEKPWIGVDSIQISGPVSAATPVGVGILTSKNICGGYQNIRALVKGAVTVTVEDRGYTLSRKEGDPAVITLTHSSADLCFVFSVREAAAGTLSFGGARAAVPAPK